MKRETPHDSRQGADEFGARAERLALLRARSINPYPSQSGRTSTVAELRAAKTSGTREATIAGRIRSIRSHGGSTFAHLEDGTGPFQIYLKQDELKKGAYELFTDTVDVGDFVEARGAVFKTKRGEDTLLVKQWGVLAKALRPLPEKWHGLQDVEARFRKRHLDLITNQEVRSRMVLRSRVIDSIRATMQEYDFLEVETPTLQPVYGGGFARPFKTRHNALGADFYLRISNEMYLKRLLVGGFERVYEITKVFRNEGIDHNHNPEFTMFEAQAAYQDYTWGMDLFEEIVERAAQSVLGDTKIRHHETTIDVTRPWKRMRVTEAIKSETGVDVLGWKTLAAAKKDASRALAKRHPRKRALRTMASIGEVIAFVFEALVEERLVSPTIIYDYPVEVSPLAKRGADPRFAERFEGFALGSELGNNYSELNDPIDLAQRFVHEKKRSEAGFAEAHQADADYVEAIAHGMPPACGLGIGVDRLVMLLTGAENIKEVILFPTLRPKETG
ncbi:MAG: lysine--tRNA ligase [Parcubacteria group bacterium]|nr:lysine--tRNA ligase [Parcubacteria group bacterium]